MFFNKTSPNEPMRLRTEAASKMLPSAFREQTTVAFIKRTDPESRSAATVAFKRWCKKRGVQHITHDESIASLRRVRVPEGEESEEPTPQKAKKFRF
jgi:hypothetical protein